MPTLFTPVSAIVGGLLIGLAAAVLYLGIGRIAGISNIFFSSIYQRAERSWRLVFLLGLMLGAALWLWSVDGLMPHSPVALPWLLAAGLLVGAGAQLGNGCTSGHGICGTARFSRRSLLATGIFMLSGIATVYLLNHVLPKVLA